MLPWCFSFFLMCQLLLSVFPPVFCAPPTFICQHFKFLSLNITYRVPTEQIEERLKIKMKIKLKTNICIKWQIDTTAVRTLYEESGLNDKMMPNSPENLLLKLLVHYEQRYNLWGGVQWVGCVCDCLGLQAHPTLQKKKQLGSGFLLL